MEAETPHDRVIDNPEVDADSHDWVQIALLERLRGLRRMCEYCMRVDRPRNNYRLTRNAMYFHP